MDETTTHANKLFSELIAEMEKLKQHQMCRRSTKVVVVVDDSGCAGNGYSKGIKQEDNEEQNFDSRLAAMESLLRNLVGNDGTKGTKEEDVHEEATYKTPTVAEETFAMDNPPRGVCQPEEASVPPHDEDEPTDEDDKQTDQANFNTIDSRMKEMEETMKNLAKAINGLVVDESVPSLVGPDAPAPKTNAQPPNNKSPTMTEARNFDLNGHDGDDRKNPLHGLD